MSGQMRCLLDKVAARRILERLLHEGDEVKAIVNGETLRLAHLDKFLSLRGVLADDEGFDAALKANERAWTP